MDKDVLNEILEGNPCDEQYDTLESIENNLAAVQSALVNLLAYLEDRNVINQYIIEDKIAPSFLWDFRKKY